MNILARDRNGNNESRPTPTRAIAPLVDVFENADEVLVVADIPGVAVEGVDLRVENGTLSILARRAAGDAQHSAGNDQSAPALAREYEERDRARSFRIPDGVDTSGIRAESKNGTLVVHLPKVAAVKPRKIEVKAS